MFQPNGVVRLVLDCRGDLDGLEPKWRPEDKPPQAVANSLDQSRARVDLMFFLGALAAAKGHRSLVSRTCTPCTLPIGTGRPAMSDVLALSDGFWQCHHLSLRRHALLSSTHFQSAQGVAPPDPTTVR